MVEEVVEVLFPADTGDGGVEPSSPARWDDTLAVVGEEVLEAARRMKMGKALGPNGINGRVVKDVINVLVGRWMRCFTACLRDGIFPREWKIARLVLLKKPGKPDGSPSSYKPICLLSKASKLLERVVCSRLTDFLDGSGDILESQYGFRPNKSMVDTLWRLREMVDDVVREGVVVVAVFCQCLQLPPVARHQKRAYRKRFRDISGISLIAICSTDG